MIKNTFFELCINKNSVIGWRCGNVIYDYAKTVSSKYVSSTNKPFIASVFILNSQASYNRWENFLILKNYREADKLIMINNSGRIYYRM